MNLERKPNSLRSYLWLTTSYRTFPKPLFGAHPTLKFVIDNKRLTGKDVVQSGTEW
jgi:hypothetical protein